MALPFLGENLYPAGNSPPRAKTSLLKLPNSPSPPGNLSLPSVTSFPTTPTSGAMTDSDPNNTTIFVGGLDTSVTDDTLRQVFSQYGELSHVKIPQGKRCGFVQFTTRASAEDALNALNGFQLGGQSIRLSWGRSPSNKQPQQEQSQWSSGAGGYYGYGGQGSYEGGGYGFAAPTQDSNMYAAYAAYPTFGGYPQQQQAPPQQYAPPQQ